MAEEGEGTFYPRETSPEIQRLTPEDLDIYIHELRGPLTYAQGYLGMIKMEASSAPGLKRDLRVMIETIKKIDKFTSQILYKEHLVESLCQGKENPWVRKRLKGIIEKELFPKRYRRKRKIDWFRKVNSARNPQDYLSIVMGLVESHLLEIRDKAEDIKQEFSLNDKQEDWFLTAIKGLKEADYLSVILGAINDPEVLKQKLQKKEISPVQLNELIQEAKKSTGGKIELEANLGPDIQGNLRGDPILITHVLSNLFRNLCLYGENAKGNPLGQLTVEILEGRVQFSLKDWGKGVLAEEKENIFRRGERGSAAKGQRGTGLGLWFSNMIIKAHGGEMWVESEGKNKGSTFIFTLPLV